MIDVVEEKTRENYKLKDVYKNIKGVYERILNEMGQLIIGQEDVIEQILIAIFTKNHALLEGYPGLGKTLMISTLANVIDLKFKRIQCTPDLMPSDITGTYVVEERDGRKVFKFERGPVFTNILLADEINRATPKTQSALLEAMQERQVSVGTSTFPLDEPFFVLATQNPIEMEGTYPLPEAQLDRFLLKIIVDYPRIEDEERIIDIYTSEEIPKTRKLLNREKLIAIQKLTRMVPISKEVRRYALDIVTKTRPIHDGVAKKYLDYGASPRAAIGLVLAAKAHALINGRNFVSKKDIREMAFPVLRHRLILNFESERKGITPDQVISEVMDEVE
ncbi:MAG: AAA family ATPase [Candidatus Altiarchaeales archaeon]|nr:MAG: AAA family ATPase [Candidatus Altiarchaeales archaeon]RLI94176.1 MAG: AAA family ATPase [Candidatus Altiarchaeales archaeon]HDO82228.1 MoxR family ATPase [Candidatus Altiarchaeales archaeon]HEX54877.1 MoxR family ATPase [Candidatus Altiarchaeales archaeon]